MDSPVSVVVAEIVMQNIEEQALATYSETLPLWLRYVDDTITAVHENKIDEFHEHLNEQNANIQFTKDAEENGTFPPLLGDTRKQHPTNHCLQETMEHTLTDYLTKRPTILLHTKRLRHEP